LEGVENEKCPHPKAGPPPAGKGARTRHFPPRPKSSIVRSSDKTQ